MTRGRMPMKQRKHGWKGFMAAALSLLLAISAWPGNALAAERIDLQKTASLSVQYQSVRTMADRPWHAADCP